MSLKPAVVPLAYKSGFKKPSGDLPEAMRKSLRRLITPANVYFAMVEVERVIVIRDVS